MHQRWLNRLLAGLPAAACAMPAALAAEAPGAAARVDPAATQQPHALFDTRFDIRQFHGVVLDQGSVPLPVLERAVDDGLARP